MLSAFVITIIITPTDTCCAASLIYPAQHLFITVIVTLGSRMFPTGPDLHSAKEKPALPALLRNVLTFQHKMEYHLMAASDFLLHDVILRMNTSPSPIPCSYLTYAHSSDITNGPLVGWVFETGPAVIKHTQWHTCRQRSQIPQEMVDGAHALQVTGREGTTGSRTCSEVRKRHTVGCGERIS